MHKAEYKFSQRTVSCYFDAYFADIPSAVGDRNIIIIIDEHVYEHHQAKLDAYPVIKIKACEEHKTQATVDHIISELIKLGAQKSSFLIGVGGGVVTDITGYVAAVYMRGVRFGFVPTTILAMVDAAIGGKNGIDVGVYKNMVGTILQPGFIF